MNLSTFFNSNGRISRSQFLSAAIVMSVLGAINASAVFVPPGMAGLAIGSLSFFVMLVLAYMWIALWSKRLHNAGASGWMAILVVLGWFVIWTGLSTGLTLVLVPEMFTSDLADMVVVAEQIGPEVSAATIVADTVFTLVYALLLNLMLGNDSEENQYGPVP